MALACALAARDARAPQTVVMLTEIPDRRIDELERRRTGEPGRASLVGAALWMIGLTLVLFFLPLINGLIGGLVGGYKAGSVKRGLAAAVLPAIVVAIGLWILIAIFGAPVWGALAGFAIGALVLLADVGILVGAAAGGLARQVRTPAREAA